ncbi:MarR family winged helix-turn-helix transcriptional regulator [Sedimentitalea todarodis]|uniref:MarR family winged helix-turn-helix transcriptional regulator n=1 Tax=Sedimentitalea todarodis TaxID=1631240 RepID=A0ABU3VLN1_9RHOB|nr:MarR family winged helix-turn-helix transcriptional regulator [Sedimentitalea todarodis]MDU9007092.1 MarR family winged helix-turn-helix transcriptional regulator [Sedimentitalea todarodis]
MTASILKDAERYLKTSSKWVSGEGTAEDITSDDLFATTELMFLAYLGTLEDTALQLKEVGLGRIHHRLLYVAVKKPGKSVGDILTFLRVTNQNIHRPLGDLVKLGYVEQRTSVTDRRKRELHATPKGVEMFEFLVQRQYDRFRGVYDTVGPESLKEFWKVLWCILDQHDRDWLLKEQQPES